jgi:hypothetical protein
MSYTHIARWLMPILVLLVLATLLFFAQFAMHSHAASPIKTKPGVDVSTTATPVSGGNTITPDAQWRN